MYLSSFSRAAPSMSLTQTFKCRKMETLGFFFGRKPLSGGLPGVFLPALCGVGSPRLWQGGPSSQRDPADQGWHPSHSILTPPRLGLSSRQRAEPFAQFETTPFTLQTNHCSNPICQAAEKLLWEQGLSLGGRSDCGLS